MTFPIHHIPYKFNQGRTLNVRSAVMRHADRNTITPEALEAILDEILSRPAEQDRQNWLEIERWFDETGSGGATLYDAIIDPALTAADTTAREYPNLTTLLANESWTTTYMFAVGVRFRPGTEVVEPANGTPTIPGPLAMQAIAASAASSTAGWTANQATTDPGRAPWDLNGTTFHTTGAVSLSNLQIYNAGTARGSMFSDGDVAFLNSCIFECWTAAGVVKLVEVTSGTTVAWDTLFSGARFSGRIVFTDCHYEAKSLTGTIDWLEADAYWDGGALTGVYGGNPTLRISSGQFYIRLNRIQTTAVTSGSGAASGSTIDIRASTQGTLEMYGDSGANANVTVRAGALDVTLLGSYDDVTIEAASTANVVRIVDVAVENIADISGPRVTGQVRTMSTAGRVICRGSGINLRCGGTIASTGTLLDLIGCDDSIIVCQGAGGGGSSKPYAIDSNSDRSIVIYAGSNTSFGAAGTNASSTSIVIDETGTAGGGGGAGTTARLILGPWYQENVVASQTNVVLNLFDGGGATTRASRLAVRPGSITGIVVRSNAARAAGTLTVEALINGAGTGLTAVLDGTNTTAKATTQVTGLDTYAAAAELGVRLTTDAGWLPVTADIVVELEVVE